MNKTICCGHCFIYRAKDVSKVTENPLGRDYQLVKVISISYDFCLNSAKEWELKEQDVIVIAYGALPHCKYLVYRDGEFIPFRNFELGKGNGSAKDELNLVLKSNYISYHIKSIQIGAYDCDVFNEKKEKIYAFSCDGFYGTHSSSICEMLLSEKRLEFDFHCGTFTGNRPYAVPQMGEYFVVTEEEM